MAAVVLSPPSLHTKPAQEHTTTHHPPPAEYSSTYIASLPAYYANNQFPPRQASINRYSWSSASSNPASSPTSAPHTATSTPRTFRLPSRVSTDLTSFAAADSSPQSRRRSLSLASDSKRRSSFQIAPLKKVDEKKSTPKSPTSPFDDAVPPPSYQDAKASTSSSSVDRPPTSKPRVDSPPVYERSSIPLPSPVKRAPPSSSQPSPALARMSATSADAAKAAVAAASTANRGLDFALGSGNTKLTHQADAQGGALPLPNLSGRGNGPVGNLLRGPVDEHGNLKAAALTVGIKLDLEAEVHLSARVRGDILVGLY